MTPAPAGLKSVRVDLSLPAGLAYEAATAYPIEDTEARIAKFR